MESSVEQNKLPDKLSCIKFVALMINQKTMRKQKLALVTGGSRGLGKNMALELARTGFDVIITYRSEASKAAEVQQELESMGVQAATLSLDLSEPGAVSDFMPQLQALLQSRWPNQQVHALINNAGMGATVPFLQVTEELFDRFLHTHYKGVFFLTQQIVPLMPPGSSIVNISTGTTRFSNPGYSVYASMKGAIEVFTKYLAKELGSLGIRANVVAPGPVETDFNNAMIRSNPVIKENLSKLSPLQRVGVAEDIGPVVAFLCSEAAGWVNGQRIEVSGGING